MNLKLALQLFTNMGPRYTAYRIRHELEKKVGLLKKRHPANPHTKFFISLEEWRQVPQRFLISTQEEMVASPRVRCEILAAKVERILNGETLFFSSEWMQTGKDYDWITNPVTGCRYDISNHWSEVADLSKEAGDIKYVWEKSRFSWLLTIIRNDHHHSQDNSQYVFAEIEDWIDRNPVNQGPNWRCSQEISLRIFNWCYALHFYRNSEHLTEVLWNKIQNVIYWSLHHVYHHIDFSRIAVRNNHAVTETMFLALSNILFPFIPDTRQWSSKGKQWFEQEISYQIYDDGTFLQFSMNYHRVMIQLFSLGISLAELNSINFSKVVYDKAYKSLDFLYQCLQEENGRLPNYGSNDGAWFFPLSDSDYRDYRPQLNTLHKILTGTYLYSKSAIIEDSLWVSNKLAVNNNYLTPLQKKSGMLSYRVGGYYILRETNSFTFIRCGKHKDRPAQADNLHIDVWVKGKNILRDSGTYNYNGEDDLVRYFMGTGSHNTVTVQNNSQMLKGSRFIWYFWSQAISAKWVETGTEYKFEGEISAFRYMNTNCTHKRVLRKKKDSQTWIVEDVVSNIDNKEKFQNWHFDDCGILFKATESGVELVSTEIQSLNSEYYGEIKAGTGLAFKFHDSVVTTISY